MIELTSDHNADGEYRQHASVDETETHKIHERKECHYYQLQDHESEYCNYIKLKLSFKRVIA